MSLVPLVILLFSFLKQFNASLWKSFCAFGKYWDKSSRSPASIYSGAFWLFIKITSLIPEISFIKNHTFISSILAGIICGTTGGTIYKMNFSSGGITVINLILRKYFNVKLSISNFIINSLIIIVGTFFFGITKMIYSLIVISISSTIIHFIIKKIDKK